MWTCSTFFFKSYALFVQTSPLKAFLPPLGTISKFQGWTPAALSVFRSLTLAAVLGGRSVLKKKCIHFYFGVLGRVLVMPFMRLSFVMISRIMFRISLYFLIYYFSLAYGSSRWFLLLTNKEVFVAVFVFYCVYLCKEFGFFLDPLESVPQFFSPFKPLLASILLCRSVVEVVFQ